MPFKTNKMNLRKTSLIRFAASMALSLFIISMNYVQADEADVLSANISAKGDRMFRIDVTVKHADAGWEHFANRWDVLDLEGNVLGTRVLAHPHDNEQPFTRSLTLVLPEGISTVVIRANDLVHGLGGTTVELAVPDA